MAIHKSKDKSKKEVPLTIADQDYFAHVYLVFQDGYTMQFLSPVFCKATKRGWQDKVADITRSRAVVSKRVKFYPQSTRYDNVKPSAVLEG